MEEYVPVRFMTFKQYLDFEEKSQERHEFVDGQVFSMCGATQAHNLICTNLSGRLYQYLRGKTCRAFSQGMKVHIKIENSVYYPDVLVTCEPFVGSSVLVNKPVFVAEVLSRSTEQIDRREKLIAYRKLESLQEYLIIHQKQVLVEFYRKDKHGEWQLRLLRKGDKLTLTSMQGGELAIRLAEIYAGMNLPAVVKEEEAEYSTGTGRALTSTEIDRVLHQR